MPRVKPLIRPDPWKIEILSEIGGGMKALGITQNELADRARINRATLSRRIGKKGDISTMTLGELEAIRKVLRRGA